MEQGICSPSHSFYDCFNKQLSDTHVISVVSFKGVTKNGKCDVLIKNFIFNVKQTRKHIDRCRVLTMRLYTDPLSS